MNYKTFLRGMAGAMVVLILTCCLAEGQPTYYVNAAATGSGNGVDWNNAYTSLPSTLVRGATYYVASGTYPGYTFNTPDSGSTWVYVKKAIASDHGTNTGWQTAYGTGQAYFSSWLQVYSDYFSMDGQTGGGPANGWTNNFGFKVYGPFGGGGGWPVVHIGDMSTNSPFHDFILRHIEIEGDWAGGTSGITGYDINYGFYCNPGCYNCTVSYAWIHDTGGCILAPFGSHELFEYLYTGLFRSDSTQHGELMAANACNNCPGSCVISDITFRYNVASYMLATGGLITQVNGLYVYGNVFYSVNGNPPCGNGCISSWSPNTSECGGGVQGYTNFNVYIINNSFVNNTPCGSISYQSPTVNVEAYNNLFYNVSATMGGVQNYDYNYYINADQLSEAHGQYGTVNPFVNWTAANFALTANSNPGLNVPAPSASSYASPLNFNVDYFGNTRATWTRGAVEFGGTVSTNPVIFVSPSSLSFGSVLTNTTATNSFTVQNSGAGTLAGTATVQPPFSIVGGGTYSLSAGQSQTVLVSYTPGSSTNSSTQSVTFTGGGGTTASVSGNGMYLVLMQGLSFPSYAGTITAPMATNSGGYIYTTANEDGAGSAGIALGGSATYFFQITSNGQYVINASVLAPNSFTKSFWVNIDSLPVDPTDIWDVYPYSSSFQTTSVSWRGSSTDVTADQYNPKIFTLSAGVHELFIIGREPNVELGNLSIVPYSASRPNPPLAPGDLHVVAGQ